VLLPVKASWGWQHLWFLVDSGADTVMLPTALGRSLGLAFDPSVKTKLFGIGKQAVFASPGEVTFKINGAEITARSYFVHSDDSVLLLGRLDMFERFSITFDRNTRTVVFDPSS
jgi:hypothetical protein